MDVRRLVGGHQRLAKEPGAEVRNDDRHARDGAAPAPRRRADRPAAGRTATAARASCARRPTARRSARTPPRRARAAASNTASTAGSSRRYRCIAGKSATARKPSRSERAGEPRRCIRRERVEHEEADEPGRMPGDGGRDRCFVAGNARDQRARCTPCRSSSAAHRSASAAGVAGRLPAEAAPQPPRPCLPAGKSARSFVRISRKPAEKK